MSYVYVIIDPTTGHCKIGVSDDPLMRLRELATARPTIELRYQRRCLCRSVAFEYEKQLHHKYRRHSIGREWFDLTDRMQTFFDKEFEAVENGKVQNRKRQLNCVKKPAKKPVKKPDPEPLPGVYGGPRGKPLRTTPWGELIP